MIGVRRGGVLAALAGALLAAAASPALAAEWRLAPLPAPPGGRYETPAGLVGDLSFRSPNRGLMTVGGDGTVPEGLYSWDGTGWHQLSTVCGGGENARIAWAGDTEFWVISKPSLPRSQDTGTALCRFVDGAVVGSWSTAIAAADSYKQMFAAACNGPSDCWFGGIAAETSNRRGAFHLRWDGRDLRQVYAPQGRAVSDLLATGDGYWETAQVGAVPWREGAPLLAVPETTPLLLGRIVGEAFSRDPFVPAQLPDVDPQGTELNALDSDGATTLAVGGGAASGPAWARAGREPARPPLVVRREGGAWRELTLHGAELPANRTFNDVAVIPGTGSAWAALNLGPWATSSPQSIARPLLARIDADGTVALHDLGDPTGPVRGGIVRVDCPAADDCWALTSRGHLFRWGTAGTYPRDEHPAFQGTITERPNEALAQTVPDALPVDDALLRAPPVELPPEPEPLPACEPVRSTLANVRIGKPRPLRSARARRRTGRASARRAPASSRRRAPSSGRRRAPARSRSGSNTVYVLPVTVRVTRRASIALIAQRGRRVVARTRARTFASGRATFTLRLSRRRWPTRMRFAVKDLDPPRPQLCSGGGGDDEFAVATSLSSR